MPLRAAGSFKQVQGLARFFPIAGSFIHALPAINRWEPYQKQIAASLTGRLAAWEVFEAPGKQTSPDKPYVSTPAHYLMPELRQRQ